MAEQNKIRYWAFKHKGGTNGTEDQAANLIAKAMGSNVALMQYEYGLQDTGSVTLNWNKIRQLKIGDYLFLRGNDRVYAVGQIIAPRRKASVILSIDDIVSNKNHGDYSSIKSTDVIRFQESDVFYEDLEDGVDGWGQRIDVDQWMYYNPNGIDIQSNNNYLDGENAYPVIRELKPDKAIELIQNLKLNFMKPETTLLQENYNLILTGAPGTGKTYLAKQIAAQLILGKEYNENLSDEELAQFNSQCGFVQFHPSYDYTDFIEGLRPEKKKDSDAIGFKRIDGVFKSFCRDAVENNTTVMTVAKSDGTKQRVKVKSLKKLNLSILYNHFKTKGQIDVSDLTKDDFFSIIRDSDLTDAKTIDYAYYQVVVSELLKTDSNTLSDFETVYDAFKQKLRDNGTISVAIKNRFYTLKLTPTGLIGVSIFTNIESSETNSHDENFDEGDKKFVFIIDEINRGEISKIMGELFFAIDPGYRGVSGLIKTQYHNLLDDADDVFYNGFYVPENVYIIGTMNDIDRSVESMDFAMRRRFAWYEVKAEDRIAMWDGEFDDTLKVEVKKRMQNLNEKIEQVSGLSEAYHIGPAYFLKLKNYINAKDCFEHLWNNHLKGVLFEYLRGMPKAKDILDELKKAYNS